MQLFGSWLPRHRRASVKFQNHVQQHRGCSCTARPARFRCVLPYSPCFFRSASSILKHPTDHQFPDSGGYNPAKEWFPCFERQSRSLVSSIPGCTADLMACTASHLVLTRAAALLGSLLSLGGIPLVLPDLCLHFRLLLILCSIGRGSRDTESCRG